MVQLNNGLYEQWVERQKGSLQVNIKIYHPTAVPLDSMEPFNVFPLNVLWFITNGVKI